MQSTLVCVVLLLVSFTEAQPWGIYPSDLQWEKAEKSSYYDFVGVLEYCVTENGLYGYRDANSNRSCSSPGPAIRMTRGTKYLLYFRNKDVDLTQLSVPATNIHTHGLMVSGSSNGDDITRTMVAGDEEECIGYNYTILPEVAGGLSWYHAHAHGSTASQVSSGAYGALIITDQDREGNWPEFPQHQPTRGLEELNSASHERIVFFGSVDDMWHINGIEGDANMQPIDHDTWYRLRLLVSQPNGKRTSIVYETLSARRCEFRIQAFDGHWVVSSPLDAVSNFNVSAAGRVDVAMKCPFDNGKGKEHTLVVDGLQKAIFNVREAASGKKSVSSPWVDRKEGIAWKVNSPPWQQDMSNEVVNPADVHNVTLSSSNIDFDGKAFSYNPNVSCAVLQYDTVYEFNLFATYKHPFHLHAYPMQIYSGCGPHLHGEFYDTISSTELSCVVRFRTLGVSGKVPMHCHLLKHEDKGAMSWMRVEGGPSHTNPHPTPPIDSCRA